MHRVDRRRSVSGFETLLRRALFEDTGGMYPELITHPDTKVFLPPIGGLTVYICTYASTLSDFQASPKYAPVRNSEFVRDQSKELTPRVHDECQYPDLPFYSNTRLRADIWHVVTQAMALTPPVQTFAHASRTSCSQSRTASESPNVEVSVWCGRLLQEGGSRFRRSHQVSSSLLRFTFSPVS